MVNRHFWQKMLENAWQQRSVIWLSGVRRAGKTHLSKSLPDVVYYDCELPRTRLKLEDSETFLADHQGQRIILDEIHRLANPSEILKIAADHFPKTKIVATGSSSLSASAKFSDTLTGRKNEIWLTPMLYEEGQIFGSSQINHRLLFGGLPPFFMMKELPNKDYQEWIDAYWAKDIQELFRLEKKFSFQKFTELLLAQSGSIFEANSFARPCEASRTTISNYLSVLEATYVAHVIRPFSTRKTSEIILAPKVYGFDTGFVCHSRGWVSLRREDIGLLWEHCVLNELHGRLQTRQINYWRDKQGHEIDFILLPRRQKKPIVIECKSSAKNIDISNIVIFRQRYEEGQNFIVTPDIDKRYRKTFKNITIDFVSLPELIETIYKINNI